MWTIKNVSSLVFCFSLAGMVCIVGIKFGWFISAFFIFSSFCFLAMMNFEKISAINFWWLKVRLQKKIKEADDVLLRMNVLAEVMGVAIVNSIASEQLPMTTRMDISYAHELVEKIRVVTTTFGISRDDGIWKNICLWRYLRHLIGDFQMLPQLAKDEYARLITVQDCDLFMIEAKTFLSKHIASYDKYIFKLFCHYGEKGEHLDQEKFKEILSS